MPTLEPSDFWVYKYLPDGWKCYSHTDEERINDGYIKTYYEGESSDNYYFVHPEYDFYDNHICPICLSQKLESTKKRQSSKKTCSCPVCREVYHHFQWGIMHQFQKIMNVTIGLMMELG
jgi:hypothetical protein